VSTAVTRAQLSSATWLATTMSAAHPSVCRLPVWLQRRQRSRTTEQFIESNKGCHCIWQPFLISYFGCHNITFHNDNFCVIYIKITNIWCFKASPGAERNTFRCGGKAFFLRVCIHLDFDFWDRSLFLRLPLGKGWVFSKIRK
jgi:hypothetical protein